jgi:hypothetical protein
MHIKYLKLIRKIIDLLDFFPAPWALYKTAKKHIYTWSGAADVTSLNLLYYICNFHFVVAIVIVQMCLAFKKGLSRSLQERSLDKGRALKSETLVQRSLEDCRANVEQFNRQWFEKSIKIFDPLDIEVKKNLEYAGDK